MFLPSVHHYPWRKPLLKRSTFRMKTIVEWLSSKLQELQNFKIELQNENINDKAINYTTYY